MHYISTLAVGCLLSVALGGAHSTHKFPVLRRGFITAAPDAVCMTTKKPTVPKGRICEQQGTIAKPSYLQNYTGLTQDECRDKCIANQPACVSFSYGPSGACSTYSKKMVNMGYKKSTVSGQIFSNRLCYKHKRTCTCSDEGFTNCGGKCYDLQSDGQHCGSCDNPCESDVCSAGSCVGVCTAQHKTECSSAEGGTECVDTTSDSFNCGSCGHQCEPKTHCENSSPVCNVGYNNCGTQDSLECYSPVRYFPSCDTCTNFCPWTKPMCSASACVDCSVQPIIGSTAYYFFLYYRGYGRIYDPMGFTTASETYDGDTTACDAAKACGAFAIGQNIGKFEILYRTSLQQWVCTAIEENNYDLDDFIPIDKDVEVVYGYFAN